MPLRSAQNAMVLRVRLTPKAGRTEVAGIGENGDGEKFLKVRVTAAPEKGKANTQLIKLLAKAAKVPASCLSIQSGETARNKVVAITGDGEEMRARLEALIEGVT